MKQTKLKLYYQRLLPLGFHFDKDRIGGEERTAYGLAVMLQRDIGYVVGKLSILTSRLEKQPF